MKFLDPSMFFLMFTLPVVVIFYMLKMRRKDAQISSIYLWQDLLQDVQANTPWQRPRFSLLMLLQLLLLTALIVSLASPAVSKISRIANNVVIIIDNSQSMGTTDTGGTRLAAAKLQAKNIIRQAPDNARFSLISVSDRARVILLNSQDTKLILSEIEKLKPEGSTTNMAGALSLGVSIASQIKDSQVFLLSDGCFEKSEDTRQLPINFIRIGSSNNNVAISTASFTENPYPPHQPQVFVAVKNFSDEVKGVLVSIYSDNELIDSKQLNLKAHSTESIIFNNGLSRLESICVKLQCNDLLKIDNEAWVLKQKRAVSNIALVGDENNVFLTEGLGAVSQARIKTIKSAEWTKSAEADIFVFDGFIPKNLPDHNLLIINPPVTKDKPSIFEASSFKQISSLEELDPGHPILRFVDLSDTRIARLKDTILPGWMQPIAGNKSAVAIAAGEESGRRVVLLSFDLSETDLPLRIAYPILLANIVDYLSPVSAEKNPSQINLGETIALKPQSYGSNGGSSIVEYPDGRKKWLDKNQSVFQDTQLPGIYNIKRSENGRTISEPIAVSLISQGESDINPSEHPELKAGLSQGNKSISSIVDVEIWRWFAAISFLLLLAEGWAYIKGY